MAFFGGKGDRVKKKEKSAKEQQEAVKVKEINKVKAKVNKTWTFTKFAIIFILINAELQIWASYGLAYLGREAIAEALSQQIVITIVGTIIGYFIKSLIENLSKYTTLFGKNLEFTMEEIKDEPNDDNSQIDEMCCDVNLPNSNPIMPNTMNYDNPDCPDKPTRPSVFDTPNPDGPDTVIPDATDYSTGTGLSYEATTMV